MKLDLVLDEGRLPWRPTDEWIRRARAVVGRVGTPDVVLQFVLTDDATLREHNLAYRGKDASTDVLSFTYLGGHEEHAAALVDGTVDPSDFMDDPGGDDEDALVGQVLVSLETLESRGPTHADDMDGEVLFMLVHGLLHVLGYDHVDDDDAQAMEARERELIERDGGAAVATGGGQP